MPMSLKLFPLFPEHQFKERHRGIVVQICRMRQKLVQLLQTYGAYSISIQNRSITGLVLLSGKDLELLFFQGKDILPVNDVMSIKKC